jgi:hypothetical protein
VNVTAECKYSCNQCGCCATLKIPLQEGENRQVWIRQVAIPACQNHHNWANPGCGSSRLTITMTFAGSLL